MTFPPTQTPASRLLHEAAADAGLEVELHTLLVPEVYDALLAGHVDEHDSLLFPRMADLRCRSGRYRSRSGVSCPLAPEDAERCVPCVLESYFKSEAYS